MDKLTDAFFLAFEGQHIVITTNLTQTMHTQFEDGSSAESAPIFYEGILLDYDDDYYYLGKTPNEIDQAVNKKNTVHIMIVEETTVFDEILDSMRTPEKKEDIN